jgi:DNA-binding HxlR family transcriptional regulator
MNTDQIRPNPGVAAPLSGTCTIGRVLTAIGDKWSLRMVCESVLNGVSKFGKFRDVLEIAPDVLTQRLNKLIDEGLLTKLPYSEVGHRIRYEYLPTPAALELRLALSALQQWGEVHRPKGAGELFDNTGVGDVTEVGRTITTDKPVHVAFVDDQGEVIDPDAISFHYAI